ncbi:cytosine permease [Sphingomonas phyllosphaerae]|uniref:cytosine permease n=1 Tax=Sphingomonas phyllosphaerae TaxID=257003 RepID=UPI00241397D5|nr:cytosine permease [Sphingomonas phyllosphaerae]
MTIVKRIAGMIERHPERPPGEQDMRSWPFLTMVLVGVSISVPFFAFGGQLGQRADLTTVTIGILLGSLLLGFWGIATGYVGVAARLPTAMVIRRTFGTRGSLAIVALMVVTSFCWFGLQTQILVKSVAAILDTQLGYTLDQRVGIALVGALIASTAVIGVKAMGKVAVVSVPLLLLATLVPLAIGLDRHGTAGLFAPRALTEPLGLGMIVSIVVGAEVFGCSINPDLSRFLRTPRDNATAMYINYGVAFPLLLILAAALGILYGNADLVATMLAAGIALPGLLVIILATWTSNDKNLYASALSLSALFPKVERWLLAAIAGVLGTCLAAADILGHFIVWLTFMGLLIAPMSGVYVADFFLDRERYAAAAPAPAAFRLAPLSAWGFGIVVGLATLPRANLGLGLFELTRAPTVDALLAAMAFLFVAQRFSRPAARPLPALSPSTELP